MSAITKRHWTELWIRLTLLLLSVTACRLEHTLLEPIVMSVIWVYFLYKMLRRSFCPGERDSMGSRKLFSQNYLSTGQEVKRDYLPALQSGIVWILWNLPVWLLYWLDRISHRALFVLSMVYAVCDLICILVVCPFQKIFMRNKCCNTCRIYNWDFAMMFTPLWAAPSLYYSTLVVCSLAVLIHWEYHYAKYPRRFHEESNASLQCGNCREFMCKNCWRKVS